MQPRENEPGETMMIYPKGTVLIRSADNGFTVEVKGGCEAQEDGLKDVFCVLPTFRG